MLEVLSPTDENPNFLEKIGIPDFENPSPCRTRQELITFLEQTYCKILSRPEDPNISVVVEYDQYGDPSVICTFDEMSRIRNIHYIRDRGAVGTNGVSSTYYYNTPTSLDLAMHRQYLHLLTGPKLISEYSSSEDFRHQQSQACWGTDYQD